jgi:CspA family cold shock protein
MIGKIKFYNIDKGYGFIQRENDSDIFFHASGKVKEYNPSVGDIVSFDVHENKKGEIADNIQKQN